MHLFSCSNGLSFPDENEELKVPQFGDISMSGTRPASSGSSVASKRDFVEKALLKRQTLPLTKTSVVTEKPAKPAHKPTHIKNTILQDAMLRSSPKPMVGNSVIDAPSKCETESEVEKRPQSHMPACVTTSPQDGFSAFMKMKEEMKVARDSKNSEGAFTADMRLSLALASTNIFSEPAKKSVHSESPPVPPQSNKPHVKKPELPSKQRSSPQPNERVNVLPPRKGKMKAILPSSPDSDYDGVVWLPSTDNSPSKPPRTFDSVLCSKSDEDDDYERFMEVNIDNNDSLGDERTSFSQRTSKVNVVRPNKTLPKSAFVEKNELSNPLYRDGIPELECSPRSKTRKEHIYDAPITRRPLTAADYHSAEDDDDELEFFDTYSDPLDQVIPLGAKNNTTDHTDIIDSAGYCSTAYESDYQMVSIHINIIYIIYYSL